MIISLDQFVFTQRADTVDGFKTDDQLVVVDESANSWFPWLYSENQINTLLGSDLLTGISIRTSANASDMYKAGVVIGKDIRLGPDYAPLSTSGNDDDALRGYSRFNGRSLAVRADLWGIHVFSDRSNTSTTIRTGLGDDKILGDAEVDGFAVDSTIYGIRMDAKSFSGSIDNNHTKIDTDAGDDSITGRASANNGGKGLRICGIAGNSSEKSILDTGNGNDIVTGIATVLRESSDNHVFGIENVLIDTGRGNDRVVARADIAGKRSDGFGRNVTVYLGLGRDILTGFGDLDAYGGANQDTWDLSSYSVSDFKIVKYRTFPQQGFAVQLTNLSTGVTATAEGFERFLFSGEKFTYDSLPSV